MLYEDFDVKPENQESLFDGFDSFRTLFGHTLYVEHIFGGGHSGIFVHCFLCARKRRS